jgi:vacuolar-type H+-ATPase subunit I/STV1
LKSDIQANIYPTERGKKMPKESVERLKDRIDELEAENEALQDQIDSIADIVSGEEDEGGED